jgi:hypothetical protein
MGRLVDRLRQGQRAAILFAAYEWRASLASGHHEVAKQPGVTNRTDPRRAGACTCRDGFFLVSSWFSVLSSSPATSQRTISSPSICTPPRSP